MQVVLPLTAVVLLGLLGGGIGFRISRTKFWPIGYLLPLVIIFLVILGRRSVVLSFYQPMEWITRISVTYWMMAWALPLLLVSLQLRLTKRGQKIALSFFLIVVLIYFSVLPALMPALARPQLARITNRYDYLGICIQSQEYTCGPAAAVNALRALHVSARESDLALTAHCGPLEGTDARELAQAINSLYGHHGIHAEYRYFSSLEELAQNQPAIVTIGVGLLVKHYITVIRISSDDILVLDPLLGRQFWSISDFRSQWNGAALVVTKVPRTPTSTQLSLPLL